MTRHVVVLLTVCVFTCAADAQTKSITRPHDPLQTPAFWLQQAERYAAQLDDKSGVVHANLAAAYAAAKDAQQFRKHAAALDGPGGDPITRIRALAVLAGSYGLLGDLDGMNRTADRALESPEPPGQHVSSQRVSWLFHTLAGGRQVKAAVAVLDGLGADETSKPLVPNWLFTEATLAALEGRKTDSEQLLAVAKKRAVADPGAAKYYTAAEADVRIANKEYVTARQLAAPLPDDFKAYVNARIAEAQFDAGDPKAAENSLRQAFAAASRFKYAESTWPYVNVMARVRAALGGKPTPQLLQKRDPNHEHPQFDVAEGYAKGGNAPAFFEALDLAEQQDPPRDALHAQNRYSDLYSRMAHWFLLRGDAESAAKIFDRVPAEHQDQWDLRAVNAAARARLGQFDAAAAMLNDGNNAFHGGPYFGRILVRDSAGAAALAKAVERMPPYASTMASIGAVQYLTRTWIDTDRTVTWKFPQSVP